MVDMAHNCDCAWIADFFNSFHCGIDRGSGIRGTWLEWNHLGMGWPCSNIGFLGHRSVHCRGLRRFYIFGHEVCRSQAQGQSEGGVTDGTDLLCLHDRDIDRMAVMESLADDR